MSVQDLQQSCILIIDDKAANLELLEAILAEDGFDNVLLLQDARKALEFFEMHRPDLVLLDLHMPHADGYTVMAQMRASVAEGEYLPVLVLTADVTSEAKQRALSSGASDFLTKPLDATEVQLRIRNLLETRFLHQAQQEARRRAELMADASRVLGASLDYHTTLATLARLAVPRLADYCVVDAREDDGSLRRLGAAHIEPAKEALLRSDTAHWGGAIPPGHPAAESLAGGQFLLVPDWREMFAAAGGSGDGAGLLEELGPRSLLGVPLISAGRVMGVLTLVSVNGERRYGPDDLALAEEMAARAAGAIENAELFHRAQQATRARDEILAVVAHDLRNPLNTIRMGTGMLLEEMEGSPHERHLQILHRSTERMDRLIQDLLDVTRIESGRLAVELRPERLEPLLEEALITLRPLAEAKGLTLEAMPSSALPRVMMDAPRLLQVLSNLVGNAIKFTPEGGRITLSAAAHESEVRMGVQDTGPGILPDQLPHVFGQFWQANRTDRRGIGLGLAIAKGIVDAHGGRIWVECPSVGGSIFSFTLPCNGSPARTIAE